MGCSGKKRAFQIASNSNKKNGVMMNEPFRVFFKLGWLMAILFLGVWPLYSFFKIIPYPGAFHIQGTISLVIGSFAIGFLLTALPRFTGTPAASKKTIFILMGVSCLELGCLLLNYITYASLFLATKFLLILVFAAPRFLKRKNPIPPSFIWVAFAMAYAVIGGLGSWFGSSILYTSFLTQGFMTSLFLGIGGKLIPVLTGVSSKSIIEKKYNRYEMMIHGFLAMVFFVGLYFQQALEWMLWGMILKSLALIIEIVFMWRLFLTPVNSSRAWLLWLASWFLPLSQIIAIFFPGWNLHVEHIMFIGTFLIGTVVIASHVMVSHQNLNPSLLRKYNPLGLIGMLLFFAVLARVAAPFLNYESYLGYAGLLAVSGLLYWGFIFLNPLAKCRGLSKYEEG